MVNRRSPWAAFGLGPLATIVALEGNYLLAAYACGAHGQIGMHFVSGIALFVTASLAFLLWQDARTASHPIASSERAADQTAAFLSIGGVLLNVMLSLLILALAIPPLVIRDCH